MLGKSRVRQNLEEGTMDDLLSSFATMFMWLGDGARAFAARWFRGLRGNRVHADPKETISPGD